jgi:hypothetical protein
MDNRILYAIIAILLIIIIILVLEGLHISDIIPGYPVEGFG